MSHELIEASKYLMALRIFILLVYFIGKGKGKAIPLQAWTGP
jgi:hypothetical protein